MARDDKNIQARVIARYPDDPRELQSTYSNHTTIQITPWDLSLDFCQLQNQTAREVAGEVMLDAPVVMRVTMSHTHAVHVFEALKAALASASTMHASTQVTVGPVVKK